MKKFKKAIPPSLLNGFLFRLVCLLALSIGHKSFFIIFLNLNDFRDISKDCVARKKYSVPGYSMFNLAFTLVVFTVLNLVMAVFPLFFQNGTKAWRIPEWY